MKKMLLLFALFLWTGMQAVMAQTKARGTVLDENKEPLAGASVKVVGTTIGTVTDFNGNFEIDIPEGKSGKLEISALDHAKQIVDAGENISVALATSGQTLGDVVIEAPYGAPIAKEKYVGAADRIDAKQIERQPVSSLSKAIEGGAPGIQVTNGGGKPGSEASVRVRGSGSLSSGMSPLYVLDGTPYAGDINSIAPSDIASITILKDATATSLYGSRGANGVIVITTKRGKAGAKPSLNFDAKVGIVQRGIQNYNIMKDPGQYYETAWQAQFNTTVTALLANNAGMSLETARSQARNLTSGLTGQGIVDQLGYNSYGGVESYELLDTFGKLNPNAKLKYYDDWDKELQRTGFRQDYNLNASGGTDKSDYFLSFGYLKENGYIKNSDYQRFTGRANLNTQVTPWLKAGLNLSGAYSTQNFSGTEEASSFSPGYWSRSMAPIYPVYYRDSLGNKQIDPLTGKDKFDYGSLTKDPTSSIGDRPFTPNDNILGKLSMDEDKTKIINVVAAPYLEAKFLDGFTFRTNLNVTTSTLTEGLYTNMLHGGGKDIKGSATKYTQNDLSYTWNQLLYWNKQFGKHGVNITVGHENYYYNASYLQASMQGFPSPSLRELAVATTPVGNPDSKAFDDRIESYLANASYDYDAKYLFNANIRRDGSSRFYKDSRWGTFWSVGAAWVLNRENFLSDVQWLDLLKVKVSYGGQGNNQLLTAAGGQNYYGWQGKFDTDKPNGENPSAIPSTLPNFDLTWENQKQLNVGAEFSFLKRISGEVNYFIRKNNDLIFARPLPRSSGFPSRLENVGDMENKGVELNMYLSAARAKDFKWDVNFNLTKYSNKVTKLAPGRDSLLSGNVLLKPGYSRYEFYLVESVGVDPTNGDELYACYNDSTGAAMVTSDYTYANANGRKYMGSAIPKLSGAITNTISYKGIELSFMFTFGIGGKYYDAIYQSLVGGSGMTLGGTNFSQDIVNNSWTPENTSASLPRLEYSSANIGQSSSRFLVDASYLNLRNVNLSYTFRTNLVKKAGFQSLRAYVAADNLFLLSKRQGMNPQSSFNGESTYVYMPARTVMVGINLGL
jgi:TonB-linked SusC/RagA family outer membrane protein